MWVVPRSRPGRSLHEKYFFFQKKPPSCPCPGKRRHLSLITGKKIDILKIWPGLTIFLFPIHFSSTVHLLALLEVALEQADRHHCHRWDQGPQSWREEKNILERHNRLLMLRANINKWKNIFNTMTCRQTAAYFLPSFWAPAVQGSSLIPADDARTDEW